MKIKAFGDRAILIEFTPVMEESVNLQVHKLDRAIQSMNLEGLIYSIPAYSSLTLVFDPYLTNYFKLTEELKEINDWKDESVFVRRIWKIPVCYQPDYGPDLEDLSHKKKIGVEDFIALHSSMEYAVYMLGFLPGFIYMGKLHDRLHCSRKHIPRLSVPKGSVGLAGLQTGIYPSDAPGGWQIIGRTPFLTFLPENVNPFPVQPGDRIKFYPIEIDEYEDLQNKFSASNYSIEEYYEEF